MKRKRKVRLGIAGLGMGAAHAVACYRARGIELAAIADAASDRVERAAARFEKEVGTVAAESFRMIPVYDDYRRMIREGGLDALCIALPTAMHADASLYALEHGLHTLCEKPPSVHAREMQKVCMLARRNKLQYMFVRQQRFEAAKQAACKMIQTGKCGTIYHAEAKWVRSFGIPFRGGWG